MICGWPCPDLAFLAAIQIRARPLLDGGATLRVICDICGYIGFGRGSEAALGAPWLNIGFMARRSA